MKTNKHRCRYRERLDELSEMVLMMAWNTDVAQEAIDIARKCLLKCEEQAEIIKALQERTDK